MSFSALDALPILVLRYGETVNKVRNNRTGRIELENKNKMMGFYIPKGKSLWLGCVPPKPNRVRVWIEPPRAADNSRYQYRRNKKVR